MTTPGKPNLNDGGQRSLDAIRHVVGAHGERLDAHHGRLDGHDGRLDGHDATISDHADRITALEKLASQGDGHDGDN